MQITRKTTLSFALAVITVLCIALLSWGCSGSEQDVAAKFGEYVISEDEVTSYTDEYRTQNGLTRDADWSSYLVSSGLTGKTWREQVIRTLADRALIEDKASELGITPDQDDVDAQISKAKKQAGVGEDDESGWESYLSGRGTTPDKYREDCEYTSVEEQVFRKELDFDDQLEEQMCDDYIKQSLADRVVRRYSAIVLDKNDKAKGERLLDELKELSGDKLSSRFAELVKESSEDSDSAELGGDIGWDFLYDEGVIDPKAKVRHSMLKKDQLYPKLVRGSDGKYRVMLCTGVVNFELTPKYSQLPDEDESSIRSVIERLTLVSVWAGKCQEYLQNLENDANIQVSEMPSGLSYDLVQSNSDSSSSQSAQDSENSSTSADSGASAE